MDIGLTLVLSIGAFIAGFAAGSLYRGRAQGDWVKSYVLVVVTSVWASSFIVDVYSPAYDPPVGLYPIMSAVIGLFVADRLRGGNGA